MKKIYTNKEIDKLIHRYKKTKNRKTLKSLHDAFEGFILKYTFFLKYGKSKGSDKDLKDLSRILGIHGNNPVLKIFNSWDETDIYNELFIKFVECIDKFKKIDKGPHFSGYIYNYFKYIIKEWIRKLSKDVLNNVNILSLSYIDIEHEKDISNISEYQHICFHEKLPLTRFERYILYLSYGKEMNDGEIASLLSTTRDNVNYAKNIGKEKLTKENITIDNFLKGG